MEAEFVPYEQALALKELGFDKPCMYIFDNQRNNLMCPIYGLFKNEEPNRWLNAPLYQQVFRWFREKYKICCTPEYILTGDDRGQIRFKIEYYSTPSKLSIWCKSYEEAELECLRKLIEIVKEK